MTKPVDLYNGHYGHLGSDSQTEVRTETYGEDLGQASWLTLAELRDWLGLLRLDAERRHLEVACGSGGVTCWVARETGAACVGVDINAHGIEAATGLAEREGLSSRVSFQVVDASRRLPFPDASFDAVLCNDSINHLPDRATVLQEWHRIVRPGGRIRSPIRLSSPGSSPTKRFGFAAPSGFFSSHQSVATSGSSNTVASAYSRYGMRRKRSRRSRIDGALLGRGAGSSCCHSRVKRSSTGCSSS